MVLVPGVLVPFFEQGNDLSLDMVSFEYQVLGLRALKIVSLPPHPLPQENIPLFIKVLILPAPSLRLHSIVFVLEAHLHRSSVTQNALLPFL